MAAGTPRSSGMALWVLTISLASVGAGQALVFAVVPVAARDMGFSPQQIGFVFGFSAIFWMLMSPVWGRLADSYSRRLILVIGLVGYAVSLFLFAYLIRDGPQAITSMLLLLMALMVARSLNGIFGSATRPAAMGYVADVTSKTERATFLARVESGFTIGTAVGPAAGAFLLLLFGQLTPFLAFAILALMLIWPNWLLMKNQDSEADQVEFPDLTKVQGQKPLRHWDPIMRSQLVVAAVLGLCHAALWQTLSLLISDSGLAPQNPLALASLGFTIVALAMIFTQWVLVPRFGSALRRMALVGVGGLILGWTGLALADSLWMLLVSLALHGGSFGLLRSSNVTLTSLAVGAARQGRAAGLLASVAPSGHIIAPFVIMPLYGVERYMPYAFCAIGLSFCGLFIFFNRTRFRDG